jgi:hypothetical protein
MFQPDATNKMFRIAEEMVCGSHANIFLTGKAGTGKTTFLKHIKAICDKSLAVVAPTGVAAINAGGSTIHSLFQLPFGPFNYNDTRLFFGKLKINNERRQVFRQLELLIIDEISMVRADLLDAIDAVLRHFRFRYNEPFGGVQVLMIGDMYQLSPVARDEEWSLIASNYKSPYFFDSRVMQQSPPVHIAFDKIYRQQDEQFVHLLNQIRHNKLDLKNLSILEALYQPAYQPTESDDHIILTTHNYKAEAINKERIEKISSKAFTFLATIEGEFSDKNFPTEEQLVLKEGARVMFIKNDVEKEKRFFNGKIGTITRIDDGDIYVNCKSGEYDIIVKQETWENIRYTINKTTQQLEEEVLGSFSQYPLRLAWAVTIHKSQGLTFEKVIIDAGAAFAPGQVYVALSRCTNLNGIILLSGIPKHRLANDNRVTEFSENELAQDRLQELLHSARHAYQQKLMLGIFDFSMLLNDAKAFVEKTSKNKIAFNQDLFTELDKILEKLNGVQDVALKFSFFMKSRFETEVYPEQQEELQSKIMAAVVHFKKEMIELRNYLKNIKAETDSKTIAKEFNEGYKNLYLLSALKYHFILSCTDGFSIANYYKAKKDFTAPNISINAYAATSSSYNFTSEHPHLHRQLRNLRDEICSSDNKPVYLVASGKTLNELVTYLPQSKEDLQKISGFGKINVENYGHQFLQIIQQYCHENSLVCRIEEKVPKRERKNRKGTLPKEATHKNTLAFYRDGKSISDIAKLRNLAVSTIESHLAICVGSGDLDPYQFISADKIKTILKEYELISVHGMTAAKARLGDDVSYFDMRLAINYQKYKTDLQADLKENIQ